MTDAELEDLVRRFNACAVPLRAGIARLNESNGVVNSATSGYHETVTRAYVDLLSDFAARHAEKTPAERVTALLADPLADKQALLRFYSRPRLESSAARLDWVEPDLELLP